MAQDSDMETALFNYSPDTAPPDLNHLDDHEKRLLIVKLRKDADTVITKTEMMLKVALEESEERYIEIDCPILRQYLLISSNRYRMMERLVTAELAFIVKK